MGFWLFVLGVAVLIHFLTKKNSQDQPLIPQDDPLSKRNAEWIEFIAGYYSKVTSKAEKALIKRMLGDLDKKGLSALSIAESFLLEEQERKTVSPSQLSAVQPEYVEETVTLPNMAEAHKTHDHQVALDNTSLLLYFGAFLFVASVGLFIAFGGTNGTLRTLATLLVTVVMYASGVWIFKNRPKLEQAGLAFAGIGMTVAPLAGLAAYNYLFNQTNGQVVWFFTSLLCVTMYLHALFVIQRPLISYILIFTFLSLFESGVSITNAPIYYYGWALALLGIILMLLNKWKGYWPELQESSKASAQLFVPLAVFTSMLMIGTQGAGQFGMSLLLGAFYYGLLFVSSSDSEERKMYAFVAHVSGLAAIASLTYAVNNDWKQVAIVLLITNILQLLSIMIAPGTNVLWQNFASVAMFAAVVAGGIGITTSSVGLLLAGMVTLLVTAVDAWRHQQRNDAFAIAGVTFAALPIVYGQAFAEPRLSEGIQATLAIVCLLIMQAVYLSEKSKTKITYWQQTAQQMIVLHTVVAFVVAMLAPMWTFVWFTLLLAVDMLGMAELDKDNDWAAIGGLVILAPIIVRSDPTAALTAASLAVLVNIVAALRHRHELNRWFGTIAWLVLPITIAQRVTGWGPEAYTWAYIVCMVGLITARSIARGVIFMSNKIPVLSYAKTKSLSYVYGYCLAAAVAVIASLSTENVQLHFTLVLGILLVTTLLLSKYIEKRTDIIVLIPIILQAMVWSILRPTLSENLTAYLITSGAVASLGYISYKTTDKKSDALDMIRISSLLMTFLVPASLFVVGKTYWIMPVGLLLAAACTYDHIKNTSQSNREGAVGLGVAAVLWLMYWGGIREVQVYTHVIAAAFAGYAYWRHVRSEIEQSDQYLMAMLGTATVPLALQALGGVSGDLYGWWLLLEQVAFMLLGIAIQKRFVIRWGLYVAIASVLYQLRHLGWAALTVLAIFVIGVAIHRLQKLNDKN